MQFRFIFAFAVHALHSDQLVLDTISNIFPEGATVNKGQGLWNGGIETSYTLTVYRTADEVPPETVATDTAKRLGRIFGQQKVIATWEPIDGYALVEGDGKPLEGGNAKEEGMPPELAAILDQIDAMRNAGYDAGQLADDVDGEDSARALA